MSDPRVSVITIFLDPGDYFEAAVASVLSQSFTDLELLLVDDGSSDGSSDVAKRVAGEHPDRVRYLEHDGHANLGTGATRELGLRHATGELVTFLDADDVWLEDAVERQVGWLDANPEAQLVIGSTLDWHSWDPTSSEADRVYHLGPTGLGRGAKLAFDLVAGTVLAPSMNAVMVRRRAALDVGGFRDGFRSLYEDQAFVFKLFLSTPVLFHRQVIDRYRQHDVSLYARGLASGFDQIGAPSAARDRFVAFARDYARTHEAAGVAGDATGAVATAIDRLVHAERHPRTDRWRARLRPDWLPRTLRRLTARILSRTPSPLPWLLPPGPASGQYGFDRGLPVDRRYIEGFLGDHRSDIRGRVLEIGEATYSTMFGGERVEHVDVLHVDEGHAETTILADLTDAPHIPDGTFDCVIFTQTLHLIYDVDRAVATIGRILRPGGVLLATVPGLTPMTEQEGWGHFWTFTDRSVQRLLETHVGEVVVHGYGNVLTATSFLYGFAEHEVPDEAFARIDRRYPVIVAARARKPRGGHRSETVERSGA